MLIAATTLLAVLGALAAGYGLLRARRASEELLRAEQRLASIESELVPRVETPASGVEVLRRDVRVTFEARDVEHDRTLLASLLADFRDITGAEEAIFWRWKPDRDALSPSVWSTESTRPQHFNMAEWGPLMQWSAESGVVQTVGVDQQVQVAAACVRRDETLHGVLSLTHSEGLGLPRASLKEWMPRLADQLGTFYELLSVRRRYAAQMRQGDALLDAVQRLQGDRTRMVSLVLSAKPHSMCRARGGPC